MTRADRLRALAEALAKVYRFDRVETYRNEADLNWSVVLYDDPVDEFQRVVVDARALQTSDPDALGRALGRLFRAARDVVDARVLAPAEAPARGLTGLEL